jgi:hypothetical protein
LSTINVAEKSPALAGKGKGESATALADHATGAAVSTPQLLDTVLGLFDAQAAAYVAAETANHVLEKMAPGLDPVIAFQDRLELMIAQHISSIGASFPRVFADGSGLTPDVVRTLLVARTLPLILASWRDDRDVATRDMASQRRQADKATYDAVVLSRKAAENARQLATQLTGEAKRIQDIIDELDRQIQALEAWLSARPRPPPRPPPPARPPRRPPRRHRAPRAPRAYRATTTPGSRSPPSSKSARPASSPT